MRESVRARLDGALHRLPEFLQTPEWRRVRYDALRANNGRCELCGRNKHQLPPGEHLNVDHVRSRKARPDLALEVTNLAVLVTGADIRAERFTRGSGFVTHALDVAAAG
jgi:5-methylcytosine-specific restriction endonuclease McrA